MSYVIKKEVMDQANKCLDAAEELARALEDCLPLAAAWAGYYSRSPVYGQNGETHPVHQETIDNARAALTAYRKARGE